ncbi:hypothetical protein ACGFIV_31660 [Sphaerisporangium sp. NPDC049003]|uniref:hypothetical protein n=1 Tax=Sphaerisporangium sp. NPDC049003 TaxID=3364517 RepID=UPI003711DCA3
MTHHRPTPPLHDIEAITPACPIECLKPVLSAAPYNTLAHAYGAPYGRPRTVADVITLWHTHTLDLIWGLGPRRIGEIEVALIYIGTPCNPGDSLAEDLYSITRSRPQQPQLHHDTGHSAYVNLQLRFDGLASAEAFHLA